MIGEFLADRIGLQMLLWLFPIVFMFHDFEEILTVEGWVQRRGQYFMDRAPGFLKKQVPIVLRMTTRQFARDVLLVYSAIVAATLLASIFEIYVPYLMFLFLFLFHVFTHVGNSLYLRCYTPGVATSPVLVLPYAAYAYYRLLGDGVVSLTAALLSAGLMLLAAPVVVLLFQHLRAAGQKA